MTKLTLVLHSPYCDHDENKTVMSIDENGSWVHVARANELINERDELRASATRGWDMAVSLHRFVKEQRKRAERAEAEVERLRGLLGQTLQNCKFWSDDFKDEVRAAIADKTDAEG